MKRFLLIPAAAMIIGFPAGFRVGEPQARVIPPGSSAGPISGSLAAVRDFGRMPLHFIPNRGQVDARVAFYLQGRDKTVYFAPEGLTFALSGTGPGEAGRAAGRYALKLDFLGADPNVRPSGESETGAVVSYFTGSEADWRTGLPTYSKIVYRNLWPGIDLAYFGTPDKLKYEFVVSPGADPGLIRLAYRGTSGLSVGSDGGLVVETPAGGFEDDPPLGYQEIDGRRAAVPLAYRIDAASGLAVGSGPSAAAEGVPTYGFEVGAYDPSQPLVLDPAVSVYCGYIGGASLDEPEGIAVDKNGNVYLTGATFSSEASFPVKVGPDLTLGSLAADAFVAKVNASGTGLVYCGYIGGNHIESANEIAVDASGNAYVVGCTSSDEHSFPVKFGPGLKYKGNDDAFVAKVNASGTGLVYCGYIGGAKQDVGWAIAVGASGNAYIAGFTESNQKTFPVAVGPDLTFNGAWYDGFVAKVSASGMKLLYCGYIGGASDDRVKAIAVDGSGNAYVAGNTLSPKETFPLKDGPDLTPNGALDVFVAKVNASGRRLVYCGYIGGEEPDYASGIAVDRQGSAYVGGHTRSTQGGGFPVKSGPDVTHNGGLDAFVAKVSSSGLDLVYCGYIGGRGDDDCGGIARDGNNNIYLTGETLSNSRWSFPVRNGPDSTHNGLYDAYVAKLNAAGSSLVYCGYIGGAADDEGSAIAVDRSGNAYITGTTKSSEATFPVKVGPDLSWNGDIDGFVVKIRLALALGQNR